MTLRERWRTMPGDVLTGYAVTGLFAVWVAFNVWVGPNPLLWMSWCAALSLLAAVDLVILCRFAYRSPRRRRVLPLALTSGCLAIIVVVPDLDVYLHLVAKVYLAGGPRDVNNWAQGLIREQEGKPESLFVEPEKVPPGVRTHLTSYATVDSCVRMELGGGFYHYGVFVFPTGKGPRADRWQRILGWPPEVVIYHE